MRCQDDDGNVVGAQIISGMEIAVSVRIDGFFNSYFPVVILVIQIVNANFHPIPGSIVAKALPFSTLQAVEGGEDMAVADESPSTIHLKTHHPRILVG